MTRPEITGDRCLHFSKWIREMLPDSSTGFCVSNLDWIFWNYRTRRLMFAEEKTRGAELAVWFARFIREVLDPALKMYAPTVNIDYRGFHKIVFESTSPANGVVFWDDVEVTEEELIALLSLAD